MILAYLSCQLFTLGIYNNIKTEKCSNCIIFPVGLLVFISIQYFFEICVGFYFHKLRPNFFQFMWNLILREPKKEKRLIFNGKNWTEFFKNLKTFAFYKIKFWDDIHPAFWIVFIYFNLWEMGRGSGDEQSHHFQINLKGVTNKRTCDDVYVFLRDFIKFY